MPTPPARKAVTLTMDRDALELLRHLAPSGKTYGGLLSELVRAEVVRREERRKIARELFSGQVSALTTH
jgi:hypothetical protein